MSHHRNSCWHCDGFGQCDAERASVRRQLQPEPETVPCNRCGGDYDSMLCGWCWDTLLPPPMPRGLPLSYHEPMPVTLGEVAR